MIKTFYACAVDWRHEMGEALDLEGCMPLYSTVEKLKKSRTCWTECGIVKLNLSFVEWAEPEDFGQQSRRKR